jgi:hypothetical protein
MMKKKYNTMPRKKTKPKNLSPHAKYNTPWISLPLYQSTAEGGGDKRAEQRSLLLCQTDPSPHVHRCNTCMREERPPCEHFNVILEARKWFASPCLSWYLEAYCCFLAPQVTCQCLQGGWCSPLSSKKCYMKKARKQGKDPLPATDNLALDLSWHVLNEVRMCRHTTEQRNSVVFAKNSF